ncbi:MAG TPA: DegT/DnrJ/EryC1/StrS family aminotransferase, partial [Candidatus Polarisedimenticolaceae bacterium]|nr:DegT/DnrJ/EryC1/StrS family aminotransferase [Candidatus Polarisedimenticolaceae bacterium]
PPLAPQARDCLYPLLTAKIRVGYALGIGKFVHAAYKTLGLLSRSVDGEFYQGHCLPAWYSDLTLSRFDQLEANLAHRQRIAQIYAQKLDRTIQFLQLPTQTSQASNLRFPIRVKDRQDLVRYLAVRHVYIADTWYDAPIAPPRFLKQTSYQSGRCPQSEQIAAEILNLPTHRAVSEEDAIKISEHINTWLTSK